MVRASWSSAKAIWNVEAVVGEERKVAHLTCHFLYPCTGYYDYEQGFTPEFPGPECFRGPIVHPQQWSKAIEYSGKRVVVIGSGATAVTLVPELAKTSAHVTMLQRSPTYIVSMPTEDGLSKRLRRFLSPRWAYGLVRWKNVVYSLLFYQLSRRSP